MPHGCHQARPWPCLGGSRLAPVGPRGYPGARSHPPVQHRGHTAPPRASPSTARRPPVAALPPQAGRTTHQVGWSCPPGGGRAGPGVAVEVPVGLVGAPGGHRWQLVGRDRLACGSCGQRPWCQSPSPAPRAGTGRRPGRPVAVLRALGRACSARAAHGVVQQARASGPCPAGPCRGCPSRASGSPGRWPEPPGLGCGTGQPHQARTAVAPAPPWPCCTCLAARSPGHQHPATATRGWGAGSRARSPSPPATAGRRPPGRRAMATARAGAEGRGTWGQGCGTALPPTATLAGRAAAPSTWPGRPRAGAAAHCRGRPMVCGGSVAAAAAACHQRPRTGHPRQWCGPPP